MTIRMKNRITLTNSLDVYKSKLKDRGVKKIRHFNLAKMEYPNSQQINSLDLVDHVWSLNDRYYKLANEYYSDSQLWWLIAWFNQKPTEADVEIGDVLQIPFPVERALRYMGM